MHYVNVCPHKHRSTGMCVWFRWVRGRSSIPVRYCNITVSFTKIHNVLFCVTSIVMMHKHCSNNVHWCYLTFFFFNGANNYYNNHLFYITLLKAPEVQICHYVTASSPTSDNQFPVIVQWRLLTSHPVSCRFRMR